MYAMKTDPALGSAVTSLERDIHEIVETGQYYTTPEIVNELSNVNNALHHLRLDSNLLTTSTSWNNEWDPSLTTGANTGLSLLHNVYNLLSSCHGKAIKIPTPSVPTHVYVANLSHCTL